MKCAALLSLLLFLAACDPYGFGFKKNPAYILHEALKSIANLDVETFREIFAKEALCVYGNERGVRYLKDKVELDPTKLKLLPKVLESRHFASPVYVGGYWSYYQERYKIEVSEEGSSEVMLETIIDCDYGSAGKKNETLLNLKPSKYVIKECRAIKISPKKFPPLDLSAKCQPVVIQL